MLGKQRHPWKKRSNSSIPYENPANPKLSRGFRLTTIVQLVLSQQFLKRVLRQHCYTFLLKNFLLVLWACQIECQTDWLAVIYLIGHAFDVVKLVLCSWVNCPRRISPKDQIHIFTRLLGLQDSVCNIWLDLYFRLAKAWYTARNTWLKVYNIAANWSFQLAAILPYLRYPVWTTQAQEGSGSERRCHVKSNYLVSNVLQNLKILHT